MSDDLVFISTKTLIAELQKRTDSMVLIGSFKRSDLEDSFLFAAHGSFHETLGLVEAGKMLVMSRTEDDE